uniref:Uncharacterized protein n=1 Tax=Pararge aegeria TaxID=116150 RepID=S4NLH1_9NEOP
MRFALVRFSAPLRWTSSLRLMSNHHPRDDRPMTVMSLVEKKTGCSQSFVHDLPCRYLCSINCRSIKYY